MVRRSCSQRRRSSVIPLEMILNIAPLRSDYHQSVLSLLYNIWVNPGSCSELLMKVLEDKSLTDTYWPHNVTRILNMYNLPGADVILSGQPVTKTCFNVYMRDKILTHYMRISEGRLMRSNLYRFMYKSDFSFNKKKLHPIIAGTHTRRQALALKISIMHICMEYPNSQNLSRIGIRKSDMCTICEDDGIKSVDTTEHNLFSCVCLNRDETAATLCETIWRLLAKIKNLNANIIRTISTSDPTQAALIFTNPCSTGIDPKIRLDQNDPFITLFVKTIQRYCLLVHNLCVKHGPHPEPRRRRSEVRHRPEKQPSKRPRSQRSSTQGKSSNKKIIDFFKKTNDHHCDSQIGITRGEKFALDNSRRNWTILGTVENPKIVAISLMLTKMLKEERYSGRQLSDQTSTME